MINSLKKINFKIVGILVLLIIFEAIIFFVTKLFVLSPHIIGTELDKIIPFLPGFVYIYISWYIALIIIPYYIYNKNKPSFLKYITVFIISTIITGIIFVVYPNGIERENATGSGLTYSIIKLIYLLDYPINCLPSIHCLYSFLFILAIFDTKKSTPIYTKLLITIFSIAVVFSTLFIKEHVIYDVIASLIISIVIWIVVDIFKIYEYANKIYKKR